MVNNATVHYKIWIFILEKTLRRGGLAYRTHYGTNNGGCLLFILMTLGYPITPRRLRPPCLSGIPEQSYSLLLLIKDLKSGIEDIQFYANSSLEALEKNDPQSILIPTTIARLLSVNRDPQFPRIEVRQNKNVTSMMQEDFYDMARVVLMLEDIISEHNNIYSESILLSLEEVRDSFYNTLCHLESALVVYWRRPTYDVPATTSIFGENRLFRAYCIIRDTIAYTSKLVTEYTTIEDNLTNV